MLISMKLTFSVIISMIIVWLAYYMIELRLAYSVDYYFDLINMLSSYFFTLYTNASLFVFRLYTRYYVDFY